MTSTTKTDVLLDGLTFPEGPRWRDNKLWFWDFYTNRVMSVDPDGRAETIVEVPRRPSGLGWTLAGDLLVVSMLDKRLLRLSGARLSEIADFSALATGPCNDIVVDHSGRAYVGNFGFDRHGGEALRTTCIARLDPDSRPVVAADDLFFPNGMVITPDGRTLMVAETYAQRLTAFNIAIDGGLSGRRIFAELAGSYPDGICLDAEGAIWVADARGHQVSRVFAGGRTAQVVSTGERTAFACMLGGEDRRTLFICTSTGSGPAMAQKRDGRIEVARVEVPGAGLP